MILQCIAMGNRCNPNKARPSLNPPGRLWPFSWEENTKPLLRPTYLLFQGNHQIFFLNRIISGTDLLQPQQEVEELLVSRGMLCLGEAACDGWEANSFLLCKFTWPAASPSSSDKPLAALPKSPRSPTALFGLKPTGTLSCVTKDCQHFLLLSLSFYFF